MKTYEILIIASTAIFLILVLSFWIYKKIKRLPTGDCANCQKRSADLVRNYHRKYGGREKKYHQEKD